VLGRFLEYSLATQDIRASLDFYSKLGFSQSAVGETLPYPYAVVTDGRICLGLHQSTLTAPALSFVKPELVNHVSALEALGIDFEIRRLGNEVFNEVAWFEPGGQLLRLVEARTFSPSTRLTTEISCCGYFLEIALPVANLEAGKKYFERFGFVGIEENDGPLPHVACTSDHIDLGLYDVAQLRRPTLRFEVDDLAVALVRLAEAGIAPGGDIPPALRQAPVVALLAPEGTAILLSVAGASSVATSVNLIVSES